jgi:hypothetical protein
MLCITHGCIKLCTPHVGNCVTQIALRRGRRHSNPRACSGQFKSIIHPCVGCKLQGSTVFSVTEAVSHTSAVFTSCQHTHTLSASAATPLLPMHCGLRIPERHDLVFATLLIPGPASQQHQHGHYICSASCCLLAHSDLCENLHQRNLPEPAEPVVWACQLGPTFAGSGPMYQLATVSRVGSSRLQIHPR